MSDIICGFPPVFDANSRLLVLGSFPSVKSREVRFYYGNKQNRFWKMLSEFFNEKTGEEPEQRKRFALDHRIALWDIVSCCEIEGSSDASIRRYTVAPLEEVLGAADIRLILLNGKKAYDIFCEKYRGISVPYRLMPSTSPANPRYGSAAWVSALREVFPEN